MKNILIAFLTCFTLTVVAQNNFKVPPYEKFKLKNGLTVYLMEQHEVPLIYVSAVFDAGSIQDSQQYGLASMTADALLFGTKKYTKAEIEEATDYVGARLNSGAGKESAGSKHVVCGEGCRQNVRHFAGSSHPTHLRRHGV